MNKTLPLALLLLIFFITHHDGQGSMFSITFSSITLLPCKSTEYGTLRVRVGEKIANQSKDVFILEQSYTGGISAEVTCMQSVTIFHGLQARVVRAESHCFAVNSVQIWVRGLCPIPLFPSPIVSLSLSLSISLCPQFHHFRAS